MKNLGVLLGICLLTLNSNGQCETDKLQRHLVGDDKRQHDDDGHHDHDDHENDNEHHHGEDDGHHHEDDHDHDDDDENHWYDL